MFLLRDEKKEDIKKIRNIIYQKKTGLTKTYLSAILNRRIKCSKVTAKALLSVAFDISFYDEQMEEKLKEYFEEE